MNYKLLINFVSLFAINLLIVIAVKDLFKFTSTIQMVILAAFSLLFAMLLLTVTLNIIFNFALAKLTSFSLEYEANRELVIQSLLTVNQLFLLLLYLALLVKPHFIYELQVMKYISPIIFSCVFSFLIKLQRWDFIRFNLAVIAVHAMLIGLQMGSVWIYRSYF